MGKGRSTSAAGAQARTQRAAGPGWFGPTTTLWMVAVSTAAASGAVDALAFLALGHVFAGVMTGNLVLLGATSTGASDTGVGTVAITLTGYSLGVAIAASSLGPRAPTGSRPLRVRWWLLAETVLLAAAAGGWAVAGDSPAPGWRDAVLALLAVAMGVQSAALAEGGSVGGPGTYFTGTLTHILIRAANGASVRDDVRNLARLFAVVAGAASAAALHAAAARWAGVLPFVLIAVAVLATTRGPYARGEPKRGNAARPASS